MDTLTIRTARIDDLRAIERLAPEPHGHLWHDALREPRPRARFVVVESADDPLRILGVAGAGPARDDDVDSRDVGEIYALHVDPERWGEGHGTALHAEAMAHLAGWGFRSAILWVLADNARGRTFYEERGWRLEGAETTCAGATTVRYMAEVGLRPGPFRAIRAWGS